MPTVVTLSVSPSASESLARTSYTSGALPATAWTSSSNASGARLAPAAGITPISTSPTANSPPASTSEYVRRSVPTNVSLGVYTTAPSLTAAVPPEGWVRMLSTAMMSPSGSESLATAVTITGTPLRVRAMSVRAIGGRLTSSAGTMRTSRNALDWLPALSATV